MNTTKQELEQFHIRNIVPAVMPMLTTVSIQESVSDLSIDFIDDNGDRCVLEPDTTGWQDRRRQVMYRNTRTGINHSLYFSADGTQPHQITMGDPEAMDLLWSIPNAVLKWAIAHAR